MTEDEKLEKLEDVGTILATIQYEQEKMKDVAIEADKYLGWVIMLFIFSIFALNFPLISLIVVLFEWFCVIKQLYLIRKVSSLSKYTDECFDMADVILESTRG